MATTDHYDVIVVGTGAGGGTLAHTVAASGKRILLLERGDFLPREMANWSPSRSSSMAATSRRRPGTTPTARRSSRRCTTTSAEPPSCTAPRCYRLRPQTSARSSTSTASHPHGRCSYDEFEPFYTKAEWLYQVHGNHGEDPTEGRWSKQYPWPAVSHEPRIQEITDQLAGAGYHPFSAPCGILLDEADRRSQHLHPLHVVRRLPLPRARQGRRRDDRRAPDARRTERDAARRGGGDASS